MTPLPQPMSATGREGDRKKLMITGTSSYSWTSIKLSSHPWGTGKWALYRGGHKLAKSLAENFKTNLQWEKQY